MRNTPKLQSHLMCTISGKQKSADSNSIFSLITTKNFNFFFFCFSPEREKTK